MKRFLIENLIQWKDDTKRKPLILRGARQVGKTWLVRTFGEQYFKNRFHIIDFEKHPDWHFIFKKNLDSKRILSELELVLNHSIEPGKDLLFFDEIQSCPRGIMALRYFYEEIPELNIIAAGSLLEFALAEISFPVGRVQFLNVYPMTFAEYLFATGKNKLAKILLSENRDISDNVHSIFLDELRLYFFIGGMPESIKTYLDTGKLKKVSEVQKNLLETYNSDFSKYAPYADKNCINTVLANSAKFVGQQIKYTRLADSYSVPTNKKAFNLLRLARIIYKIRASSPAGLPLNTNVSEKKFKALFLDIGLMQ